MTSITTLTQFNIEGRKSHPQCHYYKKDEHFFKVMFIEHLAQYIIVHLVECYVTFENDEINLYI